MKTFFVTYQNNVANFNYIFKLYTIQLKFEVSLIYSLFNST